MILHEDYWDIPEKQWPDLIAAKKGEQNLVVLPRLQIRFKRPRAISENVSAQMQQRKHTMNVMTTVLWPLESNLMLAVNTSQVSIQGKELPGAL